MAKKVKICGYVYGGHEVSEFEDEVRDYIKEAFGDVEYEMDSDYTYRDFPDKEVDLDDDGDDIVDVDVNVTFAKDVDKMELDMAISPEMTCSVID